MQLELDVRNLFLLSSHFPWPTRIGKAIDREAEAAFLDYEMSSRNFKKNGKWQNNVRVGKT